MLCAKMAFNTKPFSLLPRHMQCAHKHIHTHIWRWKDSYALTLSPDHHCRIYNKYVLNKIRDTGRERERARERAGERERTDRFFPLECLFLSKLPLLADFVIMAFVFILCSSAAMLSIVSVQLHLASLFTVHIHCVCFV